MKHRREKSIIEKTKIPIATSEDTASTMRQDCTLLEIISIASLCLGIGIRQNHKWFELPYLIAFILGFGIAAVFAAIDFLSTEKTRAEKFEVVYTMNAAMCVLSVFFVAKMNRHLLTNLYQNIEKFCRRYEEFLSYSNKLSLVVMRQFRLVLLFAYIPVITIPLLMTFAADVELGNTKTLIFKSWYPWNMNSLSGYLITIVVQLMDVTFGYAIVVAVISCLISCMICVFTLIRVFENRLQNCFKVSATGLMIQLPSLSNDTQYVDQELAEMIYLHQTIFSFTDRIVTYFSRLSVMMVVGVFTSAMFLISIFFEITGDYLYKAKLVSASLVVIEALFIYSYCGDLLYELNQLVKDTVYATPWYYQNIKTKKTFFMILLLSQKEFRLRAYKMSWIKLDFFMYLTRVLYSAVQVLTNS